jgi:TonB family protein
VKQIIGIMLAFLFGACIAFTQAEPHPGVSNGVTIVSLKDPIYPPLARQARITGEVAVELEIRRDGSVQSASVVSGHPMLTQAALNSAQQSRFGCEDCRDDLTSYSLVYSFGQAASPGWPCPENPAPRVNRVENRVTITVEPAMVYPVFSDLRVRSAKCLYLWRCTLEWGGEDYYYYRVRSAKCLGLWNCGRRLREPFATCNKLHRQISY